MRYSFLGKPIAYLMGNAQKPPWDSLVYITFYVGHPTGCQNILRVDPWTVPWDVPISLNNPVGWFMK